MTRSFRLLAHSVLSITLLITGLAGCGGSEGSPGESALGACTPSEGAAGTQVVCEAGDIADGCTLFFGNTPVEYTLNGDGTVSFIVPPALPGERSIHYQCGDQGVTPLDKFLVPAKTADAADPVAPSDLPSDGEVIVPSENTGPVPAAPETPEAPAETPPPPEPAGATISSFDVSKVEGADKYSTYLITWGFTGAKDAYLWGDFNREASDAGKPASDQCGRIGTRFLFTQPSGVDINYDESQSEDQQNAIYKANAPFLKGELCDNGNDDKADDCLTSSTSALRRDAEPRMLTGTRFNDPLVRKGVFGLKNFEVALQPSKIGPVQEMNPGFATDPGVYGFFVQEENPHCRVSLKKADGSLFTSHPANSYGNGLTTRILAQYGRVCLAVQGEDDQWVVKCVSKNAPSVSLATTGESVKVNQGKPVVDVDFDYDYAVAPATVTGCTKTGGAGPNAAGHGDYKGECKINKDNLTITISVQGVGAKNVDTRTYTVELGKPVATLKKGTEPAPDDDGEVYLDYTVTRAYTVKEGNQVVKSDSCPWANGVEFYGLYLVDGSQVLHPAFRKIQTAADAHGEMRGYKSAGKKSTFWSFNALSFDGLHNGLSNVVHSEFPLEFTVNHFSGHWNYKFTYDDCDNVGESAECGSCCDPSTGSGCCHDSADSVYNCRDYTITVDGDWSARNIESASVHCWGTGESAGTADQTLDLSKSTGTFHLVIGGEQIFCDFTAKTKMGGTIESKGWNWQRGHGYCDEGDRDGDDHNDAGFDD